MSFNPIARRATTIRLLSALLACPLAAGAAGAQTAPAAKGAVIKPPAHVDPGMQVRPKPRAALPTPVVKPPATVVPK